MKYRKKAVVVEASQWWQPGDHDAVVNPVPPEITLPPPQPTASRAPFVRAYLGTIKTLEGWMLVTPGDFIIRGVHGELYACKPDIFVKTYEPLAEPEGSAP